MPGLFPFRCRILGGADHGDAGERDLVLVLHFRAVGVVAPVAQAQAEKDRGNLFAGEAAVGHVEDQFLVAARLETRGQRAAGLFEIGGAALGPRLARAGQRHADHFAAAFGEAFEQLPRRAREARSLGALAQRPFECGRKLVLADDMGKKARRLGPGLAEVNLHENSRNSAKSRGMDGAGRRALGDCD